MSMPTHAHGEAQLTYAASGTVQVHTAAGRWLVPPQLAVWVPTEVPHWVEVLTDAELWMVKWQPTTARAWAPPALHERAFALRVTPLLHSLLEAAFSSDNAPEKSELVVRLMLHELTETVDAPTFLPVPLSPLGQRVAELALDDHRCRLDLGELASRAATSVRTLNDVYFQVGLLTTVGLAAKNAILIVEFAKEGFDRGEDIVDAALAAAKERLRPILMTSMAFILGVFPLAISTGAGSGGQSAIGTGVVGGMLSATVLAIFFVPLFFVVVLRLFRVQSGQKEKQKDEQGETEAKQTRHGVHGQQVPAE